MSRRRRTPARASAQALLEAGDASLLDLVDNLLTKGVIVRGDITLGLAGIDLIYLRLTALLCAVDRLAGPGPAPRAAGRGPRRARR
jgi:hypothetical protein